MTQFNQPTYEIARCSGQCAFTGKTLDPGDVYVAALVEVDAAPPTAEATGAPLPGTLAAAAAPAAPPAASGESAPAASGESAPAAKARSVVASLGLQRLDISLEAWQQGKQPPRLFSFWKTIMPQPNQRKRLFVDDEVLLNLFRRLGENDQEQRQAFRFVVGLILMRKRLLRYEGSESKPRPDGSSEEWWILTTKGDPDPLRLHNPHLDEQQIQQVSDQLGEILEAEL